MAMLENALSFGGDKLIALEDDLDGVLSSIAYLGKTDMKYIFHSVSRLKRCYETFVRGFVKIGSTSVITMTISSLVDAYIDLTCTDWEKMSSEDREKEAEDILGSNHFLGQGIAIPLSVRIDELERKGDFELEAF